MCVCMGCIDQLIDKHQDEQTFPCPECRAPCEITKDKAGHFKVNSVINSMLDILQETLSDDAPLVKNCDFCLESDETVTAVARCLDCHDHLCCGCLKSHRRNKASKHHKTIDITGDKASTIEKALELLPQRDVLCKIHANEPLKYLCKIDYEIICQDCYVVDHAGHGCIVLSSAAKTGRDTISEFVEESRQKKEYCNKAIENIGHYETDLLKQGQNAKETLMVEKQERMNFIEKYYSEETVNIDGLIAKNMKNVNAAKYDLELQKGILHSTCANLSLIQQHGNSVEIVSALLDIEDQSKLLPKESHEPIERKITIKLENFVKFTSTFTKASAVKGSVITSARELLVQPIVLKVKETEMRRITCLASLNNDDIVAVDLGTKATLFDSGLHHKKDLAPTRGNIIRHVTVDKRDDTMVFLTADRGQRFKTYNQNGRYRRYYHGEGLQEPCGLAINGDGNLVTCDLVDDSVRIFAKSGQVLQTFKPHVETPQNVAVNSKDDIIVSAHTAHCIKVFSKDGFYKFTYGKCTPGSDLEQFNEPYGVCTDSEDYIIVADKFNNRVHLVDPQGRFVGYLLTRADGVDCPFAVAVNNAGQLLVGDNRGKIFVVKYRD